MKQEARPQAKAPENAGGRRWTAIAREQWELCRKNERRAPAGDVEALHDLRVALRRLRMWLKVQSVLVADDEAASLERSLRRAQKALGPARDADVALALVRECAAGGAEATARRRALERTLREQGRAARKLAAAHLGSPQWTAVAGRVDMFVVLAETAVPVSEGLLHRVARATMRGQMRQIKRRYDRLGGAKPKKLHRLRIAVRRQRYLAEFFTPMLGAEVREAARLLKRVQDVLGDIHDLDIALNLLRRHPEAKATGLIKRLRERRDKWVRKFHRIWQTVWPRIKR